MHIKRIRICAKRRNSRHARMMQTLLRWYYANRRDLPWRERSDAYAIWVSEIMLQQTRVDTVTPYYERFMSLFPTPEALGNAPLTDVLKAWEGLGYYSRARNLHKGAQQVLAHFAGELPQDYAELRKICGIGDYTAGAILSQAFQVRVSAVDGNVSRVLSRWFCVKDDIRSEHTRRQIRALAQNLLPWERPGDANQALMELGALVCTKRPKCDECCMAALCMARRKEKQLVLPVRSPNKPQREVHVAFALVYAGARLLVVERQERLLGGLYGFPMGEGGSAAEARAALLRRLAAWGLEVKELQPLGESKHVFTHRIWLMRGQVFSAATAPDIENGRWVGGKALSELPMPAAMKMYRAWAYQNAQTDS